MYSAYLIKLRSDKKIILLEYVILLTDKILTMNQIIINSLKLKAT